MKCSIFDSQNSYGYSYESEKLCFPYCILTSHNENSRIIQVKESRNYFTKRFTKASFLLVEAFTIYTPFGSVEMLIVV